MKSNNKDILKALSEKGHGFKTPDAYFDTVEDRFVKNRINATKGFKLPEIDNQHLMNNEETTGFKVPDAYFDEDIDRFLPSKTRVIRMPRSTYLKATVMSIAASLIIFIGVKFYSYGEDTIQLSELNTDEITSWVDEDLIAFESYDIAEVFNEIPLDSDIYSDEEVLGYLNNVDMEEIILEN